VQRARAPAAAPDAGKAEKIIVSNLPPDVNEAQIKVCELVMLTAGMVYDKNIGFFQPDSRSCQGCPSQLRCRRSL